ncbi:MAG: EamA family transporter, partial [Pseudomonadota bacterium]
TVRRSGPVFVSVVGYLIPLWAGAIGVLFLGEVLTPRMITAFGLILAGLLIARDRSRASGEIPKS